MKKFVAHRGQPVSFPENSLEGFEFVLRHGACLLETDIHISSDGVAVLSHNENLEKITGRNISISQSPYSVIRDIPAGYTKRFGERFSHCRIATLKQLTDLIKEWPDTICFIELKRSCLKHFGMKAVDVIMSETDSVREQCVLISFDYDALVYAADKYDFVTGWVVPQYCDENRKKANSLSPDYLFIDTNLFPEKAEFLWQGEWCWIAYTVNNGEMLEKTRALGIELIETDCFSHWQKR